MLNTWFDVYFLEESAQVVLKVATKVILEINKP